MKTQNTLYNCVYVLFTSTIQIQGESLFFFVATAAFTPFTWCASGSGSAVAGPTFAAKSPSGTLRGGDAPLSSSCTHSCSPSRSPSHLTLISLPHAHTHGAFPLPYLPYPYVLGGVFIHVQQSPACSLLSLSPARAVLVHTACMRICLDLCVGVWVGAWQRGADYGRPRAHSLPACPASRAWRARLALGRGYASGGQASGVPRKHDMDRQAGAWLQLCGWAVYPSM